jgi:molybdopterin molybdotransferase
MLADRPETIRSALLSSNADVVLISGGSSVGQEDHAPRVLAEVGDVCVHGVALRPASPAGLGFLKERPVFLLPGNPVSCLCAYDLFAGPAVRRLGGHLVACTAAGFDLPYYSVRLPLARTIASVVGRVDYVRVRIVDGQVDPLATSGASQLSTTTRADGFVLVPHDREGQPAGELVRVYQYDQLASLVG